MDSAAKAPTKPTEHLNSEENEALLIFQVALRAIEVGDKNTLERSLNVLVPSDEQQNTCVYESIFVTLVNKCSECRADSLLPLLLQYWQQISNQNRLLPYITIALLYNTISIDSISFILEKNKTETTKIFESLLKIPSDDKRVCNAVRRLDRLFNLLSFEEYKQLYQTSIEERNDVMAEFIENKLRQTAPKAKKPIWMSRFKPIIELPPVGKTWSLNSITDNSVDDAINELLISMKRQKLLTDEKFNEAKIALRKAYDDSDKEHRRLILLPVLDGVNRIQLSNPYSCSDAEKVFRILGPCNLQEEMNLIADHPCSDYGGCRMFVCTCHDLNVDCEGAEEDDIAENVSLREWFTGSCDKCFHKIDDKKYSIRIPGPSGGWQGCYCSLECIEDALDDINDEAPEQYDNILNKLKHTVELLMEFGIQDSV